MSTEVRQRKKSPKQSDGAAASANVNGKDDAPSVKTDHRRDAGANRTRPDVRSVLCLLSLAACGVLGWMLLLQNERFSQIEEKFRSLRGETSRLVDVEADVRKVYQKLDDSEDDLQKALAAVSSAKQLQQDVSALHAAVAAMQADDGSASRDLQAVNDHFLDVTDTWQERLAAVTADLAALKAEARKAHAGATEQVNEAERRARSLAERLEELEDSTRRNARAMERAEEDDTKRARGQLDWNTKQIHHLQERVSSLSKREAELSSQLQELIPRAQECEERLPQVEEAVRSILRLGVDLSGMERRLEEVTLQVIGTEDSMLKALGEILEMRRELDAFQANNGVLEMKSELSVVKEAVRELTMVLRGNRLDGQKDSESAEEERWREEEEEEEEEWGNNDNVETRQPPDDDLTE